MSFVANLTAPVAEGDEPAEAPLPPPDAAQIISDLLALPDVAIDSQVDSTVDNQVLHAEVDATEVEAEPDNNVVNEVDNAVDNKVEAKDEEAKDEEAQGVAEAAQAPEAAEEDDGQAPAEEGLRVFPGTNVHGRRRNLSQAELVVLKAEENVARAYGLSWDERGPSPPKDGETRFWRGQRYRHGVNGGKPRWSNRGGRHREYYAQLAKEGKVGGYKGRADKGIGKSSGKGGKVGAAKGKSGGNKSSGGKSGGGSSSSSSWSRPVPDDREDDERWYWWYDDEDEDGWGEDAGGSNDSKRQKR